jgi:2,3,4,5-tetrahydropyridine-2-carboxylate N-succinyltransferase
MTDDSLRQQIEALWERRDTLSPRSTAEAEPVAQALMALDTGRLRVAEPGPEGWVLHAWLKQAVLLSFRLSDNTLMPGAGGSPVFDKVPTKFAGWDAAGFAAAGFRAVPGAVVRRSAYVAPGVVLMPCFINVGAYVGQGTMIDTWSTVGSCAQIGARCHISGGVGIGGVLEPLQAGPVIIEDDCFIGARSEVAEGVVVERGSVISMGVFYGRVPAYSVVVPGTLPGKPLPDGTPGPGLACAVIVKRVDAQTRSKTGINELLRD